MKHRRVLRKLAAASAIALYLGLGAGTGAASAEPAPTGSSALESFGGCIAGGGTADVLLLVDESSSLISSDAKFARVTAATYFVEQLAGFADNGGLKVNVQLSVFGDSYETLMPWTALDAASVASVRSSIALLAQRVDGFDTDYWTALNGARTDLAAQASARPDAASCQAAVWFTDGKLDYFPRATNAERTAYGTQKAFAPDLQLTSQSAADQVKAAATTDLCRDGGLADQVRSSGIHLFGILLEGSTSKPGDFDFIDSVVTGRSAASGQACGSLIDPVPGATYPASDIDSLLFAFDALATPGSTPITQDNGICQVVVCADQAHRFVLDSSTPDFQVLATSDVENLQASLQLPDGQLVALTNEGIGKTTTVTPGGTSLSYTWQSAKTVSVSVLQDAADDVAWTGLWQLAFTDPAGTSGDKRSHTNVHISGSLKPSWIGGDSLVLHVGDTITDTHFGLVDRDGTEVDPGAVLGSITYSAVLQDHSGAETTLLDTTDKAVVAQPASIDLTNAAIGSGLLTLRLGITTASATTASGEAVPGTQLEPATVALPITILAPVNYPALAPTVDFGQATGAVDLTGTLTVTGDGCVWLPTDSAVIIASPENLGTIDVRAPAATTASTCFRAGSADGVTLTLTTENAGNGTINGSLPVMISPADASTGEPITVMVDFTASLQKPLNTLNFWLTLLTALILGPVIPLLLLYAAKRIVSKIPARSLAGTLIDVTVTGSGVLRGGTGFVLGPADLRNTVAIGDRGSRSIRVNDILLRATVGRSPVGPGFVTVLAGDRVSASSDPARPTDRTGLRAVLPLAVHNHWVVLHSPGSPVTTASVLVLIAGDASPAQLATIEGDVNLRLPGLLTKLAAASANKTDAAPSVPQSEERSAFGHASKADAVQVAAAESGPVTPVADNPWGIK